jgi:hypothetical protein
MFRGDRAMIYLVRGDSKSFIKVSFKDASGKPLNLSGDGFVVTVTFRSQETNQIVYIVTAQKIANGVDGRVKFNLPGLNDGAVAGKLDGQVKIDFDGDVQTIYERISVFVREPIS